MSEPDIEESASPAAAILAVDDHAAQSGRGALARVVEEGGQLAVILLDVMMPEMDGFETLARLRWIPAAQNVPIILLIAYELDARSIEKVRGMGTVDYILKPIAPELQRSKVASFVSLHRQGEELRRRGEELRRQGEALAAKDRDIAMLAHDLQNPLTAITMSTGVLLRAT